MAFGDFAAQCLSSAAIEPVEYMTEFSVALPCNGCAKALKTSFFKLPAVKSVDINMSHKIVRVLSSATLQQLLHVLHTSGKKFQFIARGLPHEMILPSAVAEFKGPLLFGAIRLSQLSQHLIQLDATLDGPLLVQQGTEADALSWSIHTYGDITRGADSTGPVYSGPASDSLKQAGQVEVGHLGQLANNGSGNVSVVRALEGVAVSHLIGRSIVVRAGESACAAVIAMSGGTDRVECLCACDGSLIWTAPTATPQLACS